jgi:hypothetical protein
MYKPLTFCLNAHLLFPFDSMMNFYQSWMAFAMRIFFFFSIAPPMKPPALHYSATIEPESGICEAGEVGPTDDPTFY